MRALLGLSVVLLTAISTAAEPGRVSYLPHEKDRAAPPSSNGEDARRVADHVTACLLSLSLRAPAVAEQECNQALRLDEGNVPALELRGYAYLMEHRFERAEADFRAALPCAATDPEILAGMGPSLAGTGRFEQSLSWFSAAVAATPPTMRVSGMRAAGRGPGPASISTTLWPTATGRFH